MLIPRSRKPSKVAVAQYLSQHLRTASILQVESSQALILSINQSLNLILAKTICLCTLLVYTFSTSSPWIIRVVIHRSCVFKWPDSPFVNNTLILILFVAVSGYGGYGGGGMYSDIWKSHHKAPRHQEWMNSCADFVNSFHCLTVFFAKFSFCLFFVRENNSWWGVVWGFDNEISSSLIQMSFVYWNFLLVWRLWRRWFRWVSIDRLLSFFRSFGKALRLWDSSYLLKTILTELLFWFTGRGGYGGYGGRGGYGECCLLNTNWISLIKAFSSIQGGGYGGKSLFFR
jgi:hypothetical protein